MVDSLGAPTILDADMTDRRVRTGLAALTCMLAAACGSVSPGPTVSPAPLLTAGPTQPNEPAMTVMPTSIDEPAPTATDNGVAGTPPCEVFDLKASHGLVEATADTRSTEVLLVAAMTCSVAAYPTFRLRGGDGKPITEGLPGGGGALDLVPGVAYRSELGIEGWCAPDPVFPVDLLLVIVSGEVEVTGGPFLDGDVPSCDGGDGLTISAPAWEPSA